MTRLQVSTSTSDPGVNKNLKLPVIIDDNRTANRWKDVISAKYGDRELSRVSL